ncbi:MAG: hypothetical protein RBR78_09435 [Flavobacteriaceae bacterium]|jgi:hypothetical protein|nr:hypothetical protein [Flavobacteriaceae bacterium]OJX32687.1 MAG: hypothetical protein BGO86_10540 [Chryseobacterium sp. 36-9]
MNKDLKITLRFVVLIATPLCLVNSLLFSFGLTDFWQEWLKRFLFNYAISFPQAVLYVTLIKWYDRRKLN